MRLTSPNSLKQDYSRPGSLMSTARIDRPSEPQKPPFGVRMADIAARRPDGSTIIGQRRIPTLPKFDQVFAAFAQGTLFQTEHGLVAVEDLQPGDRLNTADGGCEMITWIGSANFSPNDQGDRMHLTRIMADSFGVNRPDTFVSLGSAARMLHRPPHLRGLPNTERMMTPAHVFVDGVNVIEITPPTPVRLFHLSLTRHASVFAGGLEVETYHPGAQPLQSLSHTLRSVFMSIFPHIQQISDFGAMRYPRAPEDDTQNAA